MVAGDSHGARVRETVCMADLAIETAGIAKRYGSRVAVDGIDLAVPRGCAFGFLGPNGAGKTTLIRMLLGLARPTDGSFSVLGSPGTSALSRTGAIVEEPRFHGHLTGRENLRFAAAARPPGARDRIDSVLERAGLTDRAGDRVKGYSLGMRQRLGIARALLSDPELLILDEPSNGLDPAGIHELRAFIRSLVDEGRTVFLSSHILAEVERICDQVAIIDRGRVVAQGSIAELTGNAGGVRVLCDDGARAAQVAAQTGGVSGADDRGGGQVLVRMEAGGDVADVIAALVGAGVRVRAVEPQAASLEDRFLQLTGGDEPA
jgi:ABC-2 type transport system ATP-binding protein